MSARSDRPLVMVVDDTAENLKLLDSILEGGHHEVRLFSSGAMMLKAAAKDPPDLVLLDILMPEMDGYEVCRRMRAEEALHDVPVLFLSALSDVKSKVRAFEAGGVDYVTKPFQMEEVTARVKTHLLLRKSMRELEEHRRGLEQLVREKIREVSDSQFATITALSKLAESRDDESGYHVERTRAFCGILCGRLSRSPRHRDGMTEDYIQNLCGASVLHDVGKVAIPDKILTKPGRLAPHEYEVVKNHAHIGARTPGKGRVSHRAAATEWHGECSESSPVIFTPHDGDPGRAARGFGLPDRTRCQREPWRERDRFGRCAPSR